MKGLIVGDWEWDIYEKALADGFKRSGVEVDSFETKDYFRSNLSHFQKRLKTGPIISKINKDLIKKVHFNKFDFIFFQRPLIIKAKTINELKLVSKVICYHNDNPFHQKKKYLKNRLFYKILPYCDLTYVYRSSNITDAKRYGAKNIKVLMPYYVDGLHNKQDQIKKDIDVIFIGHYENDGRAEICEYLLENKINLVIIGPFWKAAKKYPNISQLDIKWSVEGHKYSLTLKRSKIALVFLSSNNKDVYTRRCFEIPATGTFMLAPETNELKELYIPEKECGFYNSKEELLTKIQYYLKNDKQREVIANAGYKRVIESGSNISRVKQILEDIRQL